MENKYYEDKFGGLHADEDTYTPVGRITFVNLVKPNTFSGAEESSTPRYGVTLLIPKDMDEQTKGVIEKIKKELKPLQDAWITKEHKKSPKVPFEKFKEAKLAEMTRPFMKDGDMKAYDGFEGHFYLQANNTVRDGRGGILLLDGKSPEEFEAGMLCRLRVRARVDKGGFSWKLKAIRLVKDDGFRFVKSTGPRDLLSGLDDAVEAATVNTEMPSEDGLIKEFDKAVAGSKPAPASDLAVL